MQRLTRRFASGAFVACATVSLALGFGSGIAQADVIDQLAAEYSLGAGGGQVPNLLKTSLELRSQGFRPGRVQLQAVQDSLAMRPNLGPLIDALQTTVSYQSRAQAQSSPGEQGGGVSVGINQCDFNNQWDPQMGAIQWPPAPDNCVGPVAGSPVVIGGGQTINNGGGSGENYRIGNGR